ncbi:unnamed protein product [Phytophthora fragariaefolia]|uniref:Unnamed protein product n=1 Tax=Phytophthora fragariaefolia TaxID=1490495 RepID=A0A9W6XKW6_9STRA|nr:unnamed protein product [Phytophthora fragariaefolia]
MLKYITEQSDCNPTIRDVHNLVRKLKDNEDTIKSSAKRLKKWMKEFCDQPGNVGHSRRGKKTQIQSLISLMVYAKTEQEYMKHIKYLRHVVNIGCKPTITTEISQNSRNHEANPPGDNAMSVGPAPDLSNTELVSVGQLPTSDQESAKHPFESYFDKNWDNCRNLWCSYRRQSAVTLGNNT